MTTEQNNIKNLQQRNYKLFVENEFLKQENSELFNRDLELQENINEKLKIINDLIEEKTQLKQKINAQSKLIERLITIITDEHYN